MSSASSNQVWLDVVIRKLVGGQWEKQESRKEWGPEAHDPGQLVGWIMDLRAREILLDVQGRRLGNQTHTLREIVAYEGDWPVARARWRYLNGDPLCAALCDVWTLPPGAITAVGLTLVAEEGASIDARDSANLDRRRGGDFTHMLPRNVQAELATMPEIWR